MSETIGQIASSLDALMSQLDTVSNNIANSNTPGYKRQLTAFSMELQKQMNALDTDTSLATTPVYSANHIDFTAGSLIQTDRVLDVGMQGPGYMTLETPDGPLYTRSGSLEVNQRGQLVDVTGRIVAGTNGPINIPPEIAIPDISIANDGTLSAGGVNLGRISIVEFGDQDNQLSPAGLGAFRAPNNVQPQAARETWVKQGYREGSNVKIIEELINLMTLSKRYQSNLNLLNKKKSNTQSILDVAKS